MTASPRSRGMRSKVRQEPSERAETWMPDPPSGRWGRLTVRTVHYRPHGGQDRAASPGAQSMAARTGEQYLRGLRARPREVWVGSSRVEDVTEHPALRGAARSLASLYDLQHEFADECLA